MTNHEELKGKFREAVKCGMPERKHHVWHVLVYCLNMLRITRDAHIKIVCYHKTLKCNFLIVCIEFSCTVLITKSFKNVYIFFALCNAVNTSGSKALTG